MQALPAVRNVQVNAPLPKSELQITLRAENHLKFAEATLHLASGKTIHGDASHEDMYAAIDLLADVLDKQIRKHKEKISEHR